MKTVVLKLGGSLYDLPDLGQRIATLLEQYPEHRFLIFPGGGDAADLVRGWQPQFDWDDEVAHKVAIASLDFNAAMLANVLPGGRVVHDRLNAERGWQEQKLPVMAPARWLTEHGAALPHTWDVTSDSLAAAVTIDWKADELWLTKSVSCPGSLSDAIHHGFVDRYFAKLAPRLPRVRWCDLRTGSRVDELKRARSASDGSL